MKATEILSAEHRVIEQVLDCLERLAEDSERVGRVDVESAEKALDFFRNFADRCHHGKEESHLFPAMEAKGFDAIDVGGVKACCVALIPGHGGQGIPSGGWSDGGHAL